MPFVVNICFLSFIEDKIPFVLKKCGICFSQLDLVIILTDAVIRESIKGSLQLTHGFVERGHAMHAGKALRAKQPG